MTLEGKMGAQKIIIRAALLDYGGQPSSISSDLLHYPNRVE